MGDTNQIPNRLTIEEDPDEFTIEDLDLDSSAEASGIYRQAGNTALSPDSPGLAQEKSDGTDSGGLDITDLSDDLDDFKIEDLNDTAAVDPAAVKEAAENKTEDTPEKAEARSGPAAGEAETGRTDTEETETGRTDTVKKETGKKETGKTDTGNIPVFPEEPKKPHKPVGKMAVFITLGAIAALFLCVFGWYSFHAKRYKQVFFPNTTVNGIDVSEKNAEEVKKLINDQINGYRLTVKSRDQKDAVITGDAVGLSYQFDNTLDGMIAAQNSMDWFSHTRTRHDLKVDTLTRMDSEKFGKAVSALSCMDSSRFVKPADAHISDYTEGSGYTVIPEVRGTVLDTAKATELIRKSILELSGLVDLNTDGSGLYANPAVTAGDDTLKNTCAALNKYVLTEIRYQDGQGAVLNGAEIKDWITLGDDFTVSVNQEAVAAWVQNLAKQYDTYNQAKKLHTSWGTDITVSGGSYGWKMNRDAEIAFINQTLPTGQKVTREPEFSRKAQSHGANDYGDTYVEINLTAQHLYYYKNGSVVVSTDFVSGCTNKGRGTPTGIFQVSYKQRNAILKGEGYASPVDFWMPFNGGVGLHDASWRSQFGGNIYVASGSHGCINLPRSAAEQIFNSISAGTPVLVYTQDGTASGPAAAAEPAAAAAAETTAAAAAAKVTTAQTAAATTAAATTAAATKAQPAPVATQPETAATSATVHPAGPGESAAASTEKESTSAVSGPGAATAKPAATEAAGPGAAVTKSRNTEVTGGPGA